MIDRNRGLSLLVFPLGVALRVVRLKPTYQEIQDHSFQTRGERCSRINI